VTIISFLYMCVQPLASNRTLVMLLSSTARCYYPVAPITTVKSKGIRHYRFDVYAVYK